MKLPPLGTFRVFDVAAQTQSFVKAAEVLHVTHGAVSRQIRMLEEAVGLELFERRNRAVFLTPAGRALQATTASVFEQIEATLYRLQQESRENALVLSCEPTIAMKWLIPRLPAFQRAHPDISLHLSAAGGAIDFRKANVDLALRRDDFKWGDDVYATTICEEWVGPVCASSLPTGANAGDIDVLHTKSRPTAWKTWHRLSNSPVPAGARVDYEHFYLCIQAAVAGLGVAMSSFFMVQDELANGQLVAPEGFLRDGSSYCLLSARPLAENRKCLRFAEWVMGEMQRCLARIETRARVA
ncbi:LysR family transcriptional regulator, glycine cleavage system transcriptional activator [Pararobbsia alpina]|uniref:LysR substrate-binding domain-containing protein n=1 Tax=Pararobbsia alpina TaxID=621374 RepID=UPI0039A4C998